jgi:hypothetical protein
MILIAGGGVLPLATSRNSSKLFAPTGTAFFLGRTRLRRFCLSALSVGEDETASSFRLAPFFFAISQ